MKRTSHNSIEEIEKASKRAARIFELHEHGATYKQAGAAFDMTGSAARRAALRFLRGVSTSDVRKHRKLMLKRYDLKRSESLEHCN